MLLFLSDLHFTDETTAVNVNAEAFELMTAFAVDTIERRGVKEVHVILLGDILDVVRTAYWQSCPKAERPWNGTLNPRTGMNTHPGVAAHFVAVLAVILESPAFTHFVRSLGLLRDKAAARGIPFRVSYVLGNHDRALINFPPLIEQVRAAIPEVGAPAFAFTSADYSVLARHGHEWDEHCHGQGFRNKVLVRKEEVGRFSPEAYEVMAIGEVVTAELMGGLIVDARVGGAGPALIQELKDVNNLRPMTSVFAWLEWLGTTLGSGDREILLRALDKALEGVLQSTLAREWDRLTTDLLVRGDLVDRLQQVRGLVMGTTFETFRKRMSTVEKLLEVVALFSKDKDKVFEGARQEEVFRGPIADGSIQYVIYGHTHKARNDYLSGRPDGRVRMYLNTGTYLPLIARSDDFKTFGRSTQMTMTYLFRGDEDTERKQPGTVSVDVWYGTRRKLYV